MAEPEETQAEETNPEETKVEETAAAPEAEAEQPPAQEEKIAEEAPPAQESTHGQEEKAPAEAEETPDEQSTRRSSVKKTFIEEKPQAIPVNQETFTPPDIKRQSTGAGERRRSSGQRRLSTPVTLKSPSISGRKSRFGALSSKARMVLGSIVDIKTSGGEYYDKRTAKFQNTYKLESDNPFNSEKVDRVLKEVMQEIIENLQYDPEKCASTAKYASTQIRTKVKQLEFDRYKLVCIVSIGEKNSQDVYATCRFLWDSEKDRYSFYSLENTHVYAIAYCFGLYYE